MNQVISSTYPSTTLSDSLALCSRFDFLL